MLDVRLAGKSVQRVAIDLLGADGSAKWNTDGGERSLARRRVEKAEALMKGGYRRFLEPGGGRRRRSPKPKPSGA